MTFLELFRYADWLDIFLIVVGTTGAVANGLALPIMLIIQSRLINSFGTMQNDGPELYAETTKVLHSPFCALKVDLLMH